MIGLNCSCVRYKMQGGWKEVFSCDVCLSFNKIAWDECAEGFEWIWALDATGEVGGGSRMRVCNEREMVAHLFNCSQFVENSSLLYLECWIKTQGFLIRRVSLCSPKPFPFSIYWISSDQLFALSSFLSLLSNIFWVDINILKIIWNTMIFLGISCPTKHNYRQLLFS